MGRFGGGRMKDLGLLIWLLQLGISVAVPMAGYVLLVVWLRNRFALGTWVVLAGVVLGIVSAVGGLKDALKYMDKYIKRNRPKSKEPPTVGFNDHD